MNNLLKCFFLICSFFSISFLIAQSNITPTSIVGLEIWLSTDSNYVLDTSRVSIWKDQSGNLNHAFQNSTQNMPMLKEGALNGYSSLTFSDDFLMTPIVNLGERTEFFIIKLDSLTSSGYQHIIGNHSAPYFQFYFLNSNGLLSSYIDPQNFIHNASLPSNQFQIICRKISLDSIYLYQNGILISQNVCSPQNTNQELLIGAYSGGNYFKGQLVESLIFDRALDSSDQNIIETYLEQKYAPMVNLGADFAYYGFCDTVLSAPSGQLSYEWSTGDTLSKIIISSSGQYSVKMVDFLGRISYDTINIQIIRPNTPNSFFDTVSCGTTLIWETNLNSIGDLSFLWSNNSTNSSLHITNSGSYWYKVTDSLGCYVQSDTFQVIIDTFPNVASLGVDRNLCEGNLLYLEGIAGQEAAYLWNTGSTNELIQMDTSGVYSVLATTLFGCEFRDTVQINVNGKAPVVEFSNSTFCSGQNVLFTDLSSTIDGSNIISWSWDVTNIGLSTSQNASFYIQDSGFYMISLSILTDSGCGSSKLDTIYIQKSPQAIFTSNNIVFCSNQSIQFTNSSNSGMGQINYIFWHFGASGSDTSHFPNPSYAYSNSGTYPITLIVGNSVGCFDTLIQDITIQASPMADFIVDSSCVLTSVQLQDNSLGNIDQRSWNFGNGSISSDINPQTVYNLSGLYPVSLSVLDLNGCSDDTSKMLSIRPVPSVDYLLSAICENRESVIQNTSTSLNGDILSLEWSATLNNNQWTSVLDSFVFTPQESGELVLTMQIIDIAGCSAQRVDTIMVNQTPHADFTFTPFFGNSPLLVLFTNESNQYDSSFWSIETYDSQNENISYLFNDTGLFWINLLVSNTFGCSDTIQKSIQIGNLKYDIALSDLKVLLDSQTDLLTVSVKISNQGNIPIYNYSLSLDLYENTYEISELGSQPSGLFPKDTIQYTFNSKVQIQNGVFPQNVCVTARISDIEINMLNNAACQSFEDQFYISKIYPNPTSSQANLEFFSDESSEVTILLYDALGNVVFKQLILAKLGLNKHILQFQNINKGMYILELQKGEQSEFTQLEIILN